MSGGEGTDGAAVTALSSPAFVASVFLLSLLAGSGTVLAHPPSAPDHGVDRAAFETLWARDTGRNSSPNVSVNRFVGATSDHTFVRPPEAQEEWNRGEHDEIGRQFDSDESDDEDTYSIYPDGVGLRDGGRIYGNDVIRDAYADVFAVTPSTRVHVSPNRTEFVLPSTGTVLGVVDFRVDLPDGATNCDPSWTNLNYQVTDVRLMTGAGDEITSVGGSQTPRISYDQLPPDTRRLTFEATIQVSAQPRVSAGLACSGSSVETRTLTVSDSVDVEPSRLDSLGTLARYPDDDSGTFVYNQELWSGLRLPDGTAVHSPFRYFSARREAWDTVQVTSTGASGPGTTVHTHPLQVHAYPSRRGIRATGPGKDDTEVTQVVGLTTEAPEVPENVAVDVARGNYTLPYGYGVRYDGGSGDVEARPIHSGGGEPVQLSGNKLIRRSHLDLSTVAANASHVTVGIELSERDSGDPIGTETTDGHVRLQGNHRINTSDEGRAVVTIDRPTGAVTARFEPAPWWTANTPYGGDATTMLVTEREESPSIPDTVVRFGVFIAPFLVLVFMVDRAFGLDVWPPWREL